MARQLLRRLIDTRVAEGTGDVVRALRPFANDERAAVFRRVAEQRRPSARVVLEGLYNAGNVGAVARSAEAFGIEAIDVINLHGDRWADKSPRQRTMTAMGASKWQTFSEHSDVSCCYTALRREGFSILAAAVEPAVGVDIEHEGSTRAAGESARSTPIAQMDWPDKVAVVFGNECAGLSPAATQQADGLFHIPTYGFVESLNVSCAAAITFHALAQALPTSSEVEKDEFEALMYLRVAMGKMSSDQVVQRVRDYTST